MKWETWTVFSVLFLSARTTGAGDTERVILGAHPAARSAESGGELPRARDGVIFKLQTDWLYHFL